MKYGICVGMDQLNRIQVAAQCGYDYIEANFTAMTQADEATFAAFKEALAENNIPCEAANCFLPGNIRLTGPEADLASARAHIEKGMKRADELGIRVIVFGSGGARKVPEGTPFREAFEQLIVFLREVAGPIAAQYGISIAVEPLCPQETNIINRVKEGAMLAAASGCENVGGLGDLFHMAIIGDDGAELRALKGCLMHTHIANPALNTPKQRWYPADPAEYDYADFIRAAEYAGSPRCSVEGTCSDFETEAPKALETLRAI